MRLGIVGSGKIVNTALDAINQSENIKCTCLCVRKKSLFKGQELSNKYKIQKIYTEYEDFLKNEDFDFVYIGLPNKIHFDYALKALEAGKNVICEKPFTISSSELEILIKAAKDMGLYIFEAITTIHMPNFLYLKENIKLIKEIKLVKCNFSQYSSRYDDYLLGNIHSVFKKEEFGGALYDMNIYNIHIVTSLFGLPKNATYFPNFGHNGVDTSGIAILNYDNFICELTAAKDSVNESYATFQGKNGYIKIEGPANICEKIVTCIEGKTVRTDLQYSEKSRLFYEFEAFDVIYENKDYKKCTELMEHSLKVMKIIDMLKSRLL